MPVVFIGNTAVLESVRDGDTIQRKDRADLGCQTTQVQIHYEIDDRTIRDAVREITDLWAYHSSSPPAWVDSDDTRLRTALAALFGCPDHMPEDWAHGDDGRDDLARLTDLLGPTWPKILRRAKGPQALHTADGVDQMLNASHGTAAQPAAANYMALSTDAGAPSASSHTLPGEITTPTGGLKRAQATYAHTSGTATATLTKTFTANANDTLPATVTKIGILNAASGGTLAFETLLLPTWTPAVAGDSATVTDTLTGA